MRWVAVLEPTLSVCRSRRARLGARGRRTARGARHRPVPHPRLVGRRAMGVRHRQARSATASSASSPTRRWHRSRRSTTPPWRRRRGPRWHRRGSARRGRRRGSGRRHRRHAGPARRPSISTRPGRSSSSPTTNGLGPKIGTRARCARRAGRARSPPPSIATAMPDFTPTWSCSTRRGWPAWSAAVPASPIALVHGEARPHRRAARSDAWSGPASLPAPSGRVWPEAGHHGLFPGWTQLLALAHGVKLPALHDPFGVPGFHAVMRRCWPSAPSCNADAPVSSIRKRSNPPGWPRRRGPLTSCTTGGVGGEHGRRR